MPAAETPDIGLDEQDQAEVFDETHLDEDDAEFVTLEEMPDVYDATRALGDSRDIEALDADELDPSTLDDEDLEEDEDLDDEVRDSLEDEEEDDEIGEEDTDSEDGVDRLALDEVELEDVADVDAATDPDDEDESAYESESLSDNDLKNMGYQDKDATQKPSTGAGPEDVPKEVNPHQDELLDEGVEETFPASDPVSVKRIT